jgi:hypothetical protein
MSKSSNTTDPEKPMALEALKRAAQEARRIGRATGTPVYVWRDGKNVDALAPKKKAAKKRR